MNENDPSTPQKVEVSTPSADPQVAPPVAETTPPPPAPPPSGGSYFDNLDGKQWAMFLHFSQLAGLLVPGLGFAAPIVIWQLQKAKFPELDAHGKMVTNWIISVLIYTVAATVVGAITCGIGMVLLLPIAVVAIIFPILGGIKASEGVFWNYPLTITFIK